MGEEVADPARIARSLSPTQRHCILRFSDAQEWNGSGFGMARHWPDIVYGMKGAQYSSIMALVRRGLAEQIYDGAFRLTPLGMSVQVHVRRQRLQP